MRIVDFNAIVHTVRDLFISANYTLPESESDLLCRVCKKETNPLAKSVLSSLCKNLDAAKELDIPICQDTGMAVVFAEVGNDVNVSGGSFEDAINEGVRLAYKEGYMRCSVVSDPLYSRKNTVDNTPAIIHTKITDGDKIKLTAAPKGFGSENMSALKMLLPSSGENEVIKFVVDTVRTAGSNPCPPITVGVGIGGTFEYCAYLAKKAVVRSVAERNPDKRYAELEYKILCELNKLDIGPQGFGGDTTALAVNVEWFPTHIAGLPVAVNINCHVMRHKTAVI